MSAKSHLYGVGGWLGLLVITLLIVGPLLGFIHISTEFQSALKQMPQLENNSQWKLYSQVSWIIYSISATISIIAGYRLFKIYSYKSINFAIIAVWICNPVSKFIKIMSAMIISNNYTIGTAVEREFIQIFTSILISFAWTMYLIRSERIKNTYNT